MREVGAEEPPSSVAVDLRNARSRLGIDLRQAAEELRIRFEHLDALEDGRFDDLPGPAYVYGFLRAYAKYLGLDDEEIVARFKSETSNFGGPLKLDFPSPQEEGRVPTGALLLIAVALAAAAYAGWYYISRIDDRVSINDVPEVPARLVEEATPTSAPDTGAAVAFDTAASNLGATASIATDTGSSLPGSSLSDGIANGATEPTPAVASASLGEPLATTGETAPPLSTMAVDTAKTEPTIVSTTFATGDQALKRLQPAAETPPTISTSSPTAPTITAPLIIPPTTVAPAAAASTTAIPSTSEPSETAEATTAQATTTTAATGATIVATAVPATPVTVRSSTPKRTGVVQRRQSVRPARRSIATVATTAVPAVPPPPVASADYVPRSFGQGSAGSRIEIRAEAESWVQVTGVDNELLLTRILRPGDVYHVPDQPGLVLMTGNAGGIRITVDGKAAPSLGNNGDVRRNVALDPKRLLAGTATRR